ASAVAGEVRRRRRYALDRRELAALAVLAIGRERRIELVDHIGERLGGMEVDVPRRRTGPGRDLVDVDRDAALGIDPIGHDTVGALVGHVEEAALGVEWIVVRADVLLLGAVRTDVALVRRQGRVRAKRAVGLDRE